MLVVLVFLFAVLWLQIHNSGQLLSWPCSKWSESRSVMFDSLWPHGLYIPWNSPGQNTGVGSLSLLQGIFPTQGSNPCLLHCRRILYQLSHKGSPCSEGHCQFLCLFVCFFVTFIVLNFLADQSFKLTFSFFLSMDYFNLLKVKSIGQEAFF